MLLQKRGIVFLVFIKAKTVTGRICRELKVFQQCTERRPRHRSQGIDNLRRDTTSIEEHGKAFIQLLLEFVKSRFVFSGQNLQHAVQVFISQ